VGARPESLDQGAVGARSGTQFEKSEKLTIGCAFEYADLGDAEINNSNPINGDLGDAEINNSNPINGLKGEYKNNDFLAFIINFNWKF